MSQSSQTSLCIEPGKPVAVIRLSDFREPIPLCRSLLAGGIITLEFAMSNPDALATISRVRQALPEQEVLGAGTLLNADDANAAIRARAQVLLAPALIPQVLSNAN